MKEKIMAYELKCASCGQAFQANDKEQLARNVEQHNREQHGTGLDRQKFEERVQQK
jgi:predicted small metal-binding protein